MSNLIIDEWLWSDLSGDNSDKKKKEALDFLRAVYKKCDKIVTVRGSRFVQKFWGLCSLPYCNNCHTIVRYFRGYFLYNSKKSELLEEASLVPIPMKLADLVNPDDYYLVQALLSSDAQALITTDGPLRNALVENNINCVHRDDFVSDYILKNG